MPLQQMENKYTRDTEDFRMRNSHSLRQKRRETNRIDNLLYKRTDAERRQQLNQRKSGPTTAGQDLQIDPHKLCGDLQKAPAML